jgi:hypothetical protein
MDDGLHEDKMRRSFPTTGILIVALAFLAVAAAGCADEAADDVTVKGVTSTETSGATTATVEAKPPAAGMELDPGLQSATGTPTSTEMPALLELQAKVPYHVTVPTYLPGGYQLDTALIGHGSKTASDPVGYYSFRYYDPDDPNRTMTFNQSVANNKPLSGYYLTEVSVNGTPFQVYWHKTLEYLPQGDPVRADYVGEAETYVITWKSQFEDTDGTVREVYYGLTTGTWTGHDWGTMEEILASLKPLATVAG